MKRFEGKNVLVTGGNSGIGRAAALAFAKEGARVLITGRDQSTLNQAAAQLGEKAIAVQNDASSVADGIRLTTLLEQLGLRLDAAFINAGVTKLAPFDEVGEAMWDVTFNTNVKGPYFLIKALIPLLNPGAAIVLNGSINAHIGMPSSSVYAASKAALISLAKTLSSELLSRGVRVNVVSPGPISTPLYDRLGLPAEQLSTGGTKERCGWLKDKFGVSWQIIPSVLGKLLNDPDPVKSKRVMQAMLQMNKIDIKGLKNAYEQG